MPDILPVSMQDILHSWKSELREYKIADVIELAFYRFHRLHNKRKQFKQRFTSRCLFPRSNEKKIGKGTDEN